MVVRWLIPYFISVVREGRSAGRSPANRTELLMCSGKRARSATLRDLRHVILRQKEFQYRRYLRYSQEAINGVFLF